MTSRHFLLKQIIFIHCNPLGCSIEVTTQRNGQTHPPTTTSNSQLSKCVVIVGGDDGETKRQSGGTPEE